MAGEQWTLRGSEAAVAQERLGAPCPLLIQGSLEEGRATNLSSPLRIKASFAGGRVKSPWFLRPPERGFYPHDPYTARLRSTGFPAPPPGGGPPPTACGKKTIR